MVFEAKISDGKLEIINREEFRKYLASLGDRRITIRIEKVSDKRTLKQNKALHKYFELLAEALNESGWDMKKTIKVDVPWTKDTVKEYLWRPVQKAYLKKHSTTELNKQQDITKIYDIINRAISERTGVSVPFPSDSEDTIV